MTKQNLDAKLARLSHFTTPPAGVVAEAIDAYAAHVADLEAVIARQNVRIGEEVGFQTFIRKSERDVRDDLSKRHRDEKRRLIQELGFAAVIRDRVMAAQWQGRKTVKVAALLEGRPAEEAAA